MDTSIVEGEIDPTEGLDDLGDHRFHSGFLRHVADDTHRLVATAEVCAGALYRLCIDIDNGDRGAGLGECLCRCEADAGAPPVTSATLPSKDMLMCLPFV
jgi:hypothetical protein